MRILTLVLLSTVAFSATACTSMDRKDQSSTLPKLTFAQLQPLPIDVAQVVVNTGVPDQSGTNPISHTPLAEAFSNYAKQRFVGMGGAGTGTLTVTLNETRVSKGTKNSENKWVSWTNLDRVDGYIAAVKATLRYDSDNRTIYKEAVLKQERGIDIPQRTTLAERQALEQRLIEQLIGDFDKQAVPALQSNLQVLGAVSMSQQQPAMMQPVAQQPVMQTPVAQPQMQGQQPLQWGQPQTSGAPASAYPVIGQ